MPYVDAKGGVFRASRSSGSRSSKDPPPLAMQPPARLLIRNGHSPTVQESLERRGVVLESDPTKAHAVIVENVREQDSVAALAARLFGLRLACRRWLTSGMVEGECFQFE